jgi:hypothetical protein
VEEVHHRVAPLGLFRIAGRQVHDDRTIRRIAFEVALEGVAVDRDAVERACRP